MLIWQNCPKCGSRMIMKGGKYGIFWSCCRFPKCSYGRDLTKEELNYFENGYGQLKLID